MIPARQADRTIAYEKTARLIFEDYYKAKDADYKPTASRVLGIDELYLGRVYRHLHNITKSTVIDLLPNRNKPTIVNFLSHLPESATPGGRPEFLPTRRRCGSR